MGLAPAVGAADDSGRYLLPESRSDMSLTKVALVAIIAVMVAKLALSKFVPSLATYL